MFSFFKNSKPKKPSPQTEEKLSREELKKQAIANMRVAVDNLGGEEKIQEMAAALRKQEAPPRQETEGEKARRKIEKMDGAHIADHIKIILEEDRK